MGGGGRDENSSLWNISHFKFVQNCLHNCQAAVLNRLMLKFTKIVCCTVAFATRSAFVDRVQLNSVGTKPLAVDSSSCCTFCIYCAVFLLLCFVSDAQAQNR